jgi:glycosyltransferase involved in cell wall biosynthesis
MRVLLNATTDELLRLGGDFTHYQDWRKLREEGLEFEFLAAAGLRRRSTFLRKGFEKLCRTWQPPSVRRQLLLASRFLYVPRVALEGVDLIFSHVLFPWTAGARVPIVWNSQGISPALYYERYNRGQWTVEDVAFVYHALGQRADALVIFTHACARNVLEWCPELAGKVHVVPAPIFVPSREFPEKPSRKDGQLRLLFVGVDAERKGLPEVVDAFQWLRRKYGNLLLDIVSRPSEKLQRKVAALQGATLHISSPDVDIPSLMARADMFVLPTRADTYALAAVEAMAYACAIILSDLEPLPEVAPENEVGFIVPPGNIGALVDKLEVLITCEDLLRQFQAGAWQRYLSYHTPEVVAKRLKEVFSPLFAVGKGEAL